jgi:fimbrial chaperone protein
MKILQFLFLFVVIQQIAYAFKVTPMVVQFNSKGDGKTQTFTASNTKSQKVAVEVVAKTRSLNLQGEEKRSDTQSFVIFPPQLILSPGQTKKIRVTYVGGAA